MESKLQEWARALQVITQSGVSITNYSIMTAQLESRLRTTVAEMMAADINEDIEPIPGLLENMPGYAISRVTVRGAVFRDDDILLVRAPSLGRESWTPAWRVCRNQRVPQSNDDKRNSGRNRISNRSGEVGRGVVRHPPPSIRYSCSSIFPM